MGPFARRELTQRLLLAGLLGLGFIAGANPYPPYYDGGAGAAIHWAPVAWPDEVDWIPYTLQGYDEKDNQVQDPSNGGTSPQNYVNITSGCTDLSEPSVYWYYDAVNEIVFFRWRVQQQANTYATGPNPGSFSSSDAWNSALWTVLIDIDGDGYREFSVMLDGSSGEPATAIDRLVGYYSDTPVQYPDSPEIAHNPSAFVDGNGATTTDTLLNFQGAVTPTTSWPNGASETDWDYGTTRFVEVTGTTCDEHWVMYQIPLGLMDASAQGGPTVDGDTPLALLFATSNSLQNPLQKDVIFDGTFIADPTQPAPFGDTITLNGGTIQQPIVEEIVANGCGPATLTATVRDSMTVVGGNPVSTLTAVEFYYYEDDNANGVADDGNSWTLAGAGSTTGTVGQYTLSWDSTALGQGLFLVGVQAVDNGSANASGVAHRTFSYLTAAEVLLEPVAPGEANFANPSPEPGVVTADPPYSNTCGVPPPSISKVISPETQTAGGDITLTISITNPLASSITLSSITDTLPTGFSYNDPPGTSGTLSPTTSPTNGDSGAIVWTFAPAATIGAGATETLIFDATVSTVVGSYTNLLEAVTSAGTLDGDPVQVGVGAPRPTILKSADVNTANPGDTITYTLTYSNDSPISMTGVVIDDTIPTGATYVASSLVLDGVAQTDANDTDDAYYDGGVPEVIFNVGDLPAGDGPFTATFQVTVDNPYPGAAPIPMANTATINSNEGAPESSTSNTFINSPRANFAIQKDGDIQLAPGGSGTYTISYENIGNATANNTVITDTIPDGFTFVSATAGGTHDGGSPGTVTWTIGTVIAGGSGSVDITIQADAPFSDTNPATNIATIDSDETTPTQDTFQIGVNIPAGGDCFVSFAFTDTSDSDAVLSKVLVDDATGGSDPVNRDTYEAPQGAYDTAIYQEFTFPSNMVSAGASVTDASVATFQYFEKNLNEARLDAYAAGDTSGAPDSTFVFDPSVSQNSEITETGDLFSSGIDTPAELNGLVLRFLSWSSQASANARKQEIDFLEVCITTSQPPVLVIDKQVDTFEATPGDTLVYTIEFANIGGADATGANILDTLPTGVTFVSATLNGSPKTPDVIAGQDYTFNVNSSDTATVGQVTAAQSGTLVITATVDSPLDESAFSLQNDATLDSNETTPELDSATTAVIRPEISISKSADKTLLIPGDTVTFTISVLNSGDAAATNVDITDVIPADTYFEYVASSISGGDSNDDTGAPTLTWRINSLAAGATQSVSFQMFVRDTAPLPPDGVTTKVNNATEDNDTLSGTRTSNDVTVSISTNPNLRVTKTVSPAAGPYEPGDSLSYSILIENIGDGDATGVQVRDEIPNNTSYVNGSLFVDLVAKTDANDADEAYFDASNNRTIFNVGTIAGSGSVTVDLSVQVNEVMPNGTTSVSNTAEASASNAATKSDDLLVDVPAAPVLELTKDGAENIAYPATTLAATVAAVLSFDVNDTTQLSIGQTLRINGTDTTITNITGTTVDVDVAITGSINDPVYGGITYSLNYQNSGNADATGVSLVDTLPAGVDYVSSTGGGVYAPGPHDVTWSIGDLDAGAFGSVQVVVMPTATGDITNSADLDSNELPTVNDTLDTGVGGLLISKSTTTPNVTNTTSGAQATYVITIENTRASGFTNVDVTDTLGNGFTYNSTTSIVFSATGSGPTGSPTLGDNPATWSGFTIAASETVTITFVADIDNTVGEATYQNAVAVTQNGGTDGIIQFDELNTSDEDVAVTVPLADLSLDKVVSDTTPGVGDTVTFTITVTNDGPDAATNVDVEDVLPIGYSYVGSSIAGGDSNSDAGDPTLTWTINSLAASGTSVLTYQATVQAEGPGVTYANAAEVVDVDQFDPDSTPNDGTGDDYDSEDVPPAAADLSLTKAPSDATPDVGDTITFTITVTNSGSDVATNVAVEDVLPNGYAYVASSITGGDSNDDTGKPTLTWAISSIAVSGTSVLTYQAVAQAPGVGVSHANAAEVTASDLADPDSTPNDGMGDDYDSQNVVPNQADLSIDKVPSATDPNVGDTVTFTITVSNGGPDPAENVDVEDVIPNGYAYVGASITGGDSNSDAGDPTLSWTINSLAASGTSVLTYQAVAQAPGFGVTYANAAEVVDSDTFDPDSTPNDQLGDDHDSEDVVPNQADLFLTKTPSDFSPSVSDTVTFTIVVSNTGPDTATNVDIEDVLPNGVVYVASSITGGDSNDDTGAPTLTWTVNSIAASGAAVLTYQGVIQATGPGVSYTNAAQVTDTDVFDPDSTPNDGTGDDFDSVNLSPTSADLSLTKTPSTTTPNVGDTVTFTINLQNAGPSAANNITVRDVLPNGYSYVGSSIAGGDAQNDTGDPTLTWTVTTLAASSSSVLTYQAVVQAPGGGVSHSNAAEVTAVDESDPDSTPNDGAGDDYDSQDVPPNEADLSLVKVPSDATPDVGDTVTFTITVTNGGPDTATNIDIGDVLPNGYSYVGSSITGGDSNSDAGAPTLQWSVNSLAASGNAVLTYQAVVQAPGAGVSHANAAEVTASDVHDPDSTPNDGMGDDYDSEDVTPNEADLSINKTVSDTTPLVGDTVFFFITVSNDGPDTAVNVDVEDVIPNGYSYVASSISGGDSNSDAGAPTLTWTINSLVASGSAVLIYQAEVQAPGVGISHANAAEVVDTDTFDPDSTPNDGMGDDYDSEDVPPEQADLSLVKVASDPSPSVSDVVTFTITVTNGGPDAATNVDVEDVIPNGYSYTAASIAGGDSNDDTGDPTLTWTVNSLAASGTSVLTYTATVLVPGVGISHANAAQVTDVDQFDPDSTPNDGMGDDYDSVDAAPAGDTDCDGIPDALDLDDDNDGIPDTVEGGGDADGDGIIDSLDLDSDNDGIPDVVEAGGVDADGDGFIDNFADTDNDGLSDNVDPDNGGTALPFDDTDSDGIADSVDLDSDNDGVPDVVEAGGTDADGDGIADSFVDTDSDGFNDEVDGDVGNDGVAENSADALTLTGPDTDGDGDGAPNSYPNDDPDGDGLLNYKDLDADGDTIPDVTESGGTDANDDGIIDSFATDTDSDGFADPVDGDVGNDGVAENMAGALVVTGADTDSDGAPNSYPEANADGTGFPNFLDIDADDDGITDLTEAGADPNNPVDSDTDGVPDYLDIDADNDGIPDNIEAQTTTGYVAPSGTDSDNDGLDDVYDADDADTTVAASVGVTPEDTDGDTTPDYLDSDSDDDGITDEVESGRGLVGAFTDADGDGLDDSVDNVVGPDVNDNIGDPVTDLTDTDGDALAPTGDVDYRDTEDADGDGIPDSIDLDDDNDGIPDLTEGGGVDPSGDHDFDGVPNYVDTDYPGFVDANGDNVNDNFDNDRDGISDHLDLDSDNDGIPDVVEAGGIDADGDGLIDNFADTDNDGLSDNVDPDNGGTALPFDDTDLDGIPDSVDLDADNDGVPDVVEAGGTDADGDGIADDYVDTDSDGFNDVVDGDVGNDGVAENSADALTLTGPDTDNDGAPNSYPNDDPDGDGLLNYKDLDADGDTIPDVTESGGTDANDDGIIDSFGTDTDNDGFADPVDGDVGNDGVAENTAGALVTTGADTDGDGAPNSYPEANADGTGFPNFLDIDADDDGITDLTEAGADPNNPVNTDSASGDTVPDYLDIDADNDGIPDNIEAQTTTGYVAPSGTDSDNDGLDDVYDADDADTTVAASVGVTPEDTDGDTTPDYLDSDSDDDGLLDEVESGRGLVGAFTDADGDGLDDSVDNVVGPDVNDNIGDPVTDLTDTDGDALALTGDVDYRDTEDADGDGIPDTIDLDDDNDGIPDLTEGGGVDPSADHDFDGVPNYVDTDYPGFVDANGDNVNDNFDNDGDGIPDHLDLDSDNDGIPDVVEAGGVDTDGDGRIDNFADTDNDGLSDNVDPDNGGTALPLPDTDSDGVDDYLDVDSDNDGITDTVEAGGTDADGDGVADGYVDTDLDGFNDTVDGDVGNDGIAEGSANALTLTGPDTDGDGAPNSYPNDDFDGDGLLNYLDIDADDDGIPDNIEGQPTVGYIAPSGTDTDGDGLDDAYDTDNGGTPLPITNTDGAGQPDYLDLDADDDGISDTVESNRGTATGADVDNDGLDDGFDNVIGGWVPNDAIFTPESSSELPDGDGDVLTGGDVNYRDIDPLVFSMVKTETGSGSYTIGETITYQVTLTIWQGVANNVQLVDILPGDLEYTAGTAALSYAGMTVGNDPPTVSYVSATRTLTLDLGQVTNPADASPDTIVITYDALVENTANNNNSDTKVNNATMSADGVPDTSDTTSITLTEPVLQLVKTISPNPATNLDAGDTITYNLIVTHTGASTATAYDVLISDLVDSGSGHLLITTASAVVSGGATVDVAPAIGGGGTTVTGQFDIPVGGQVILVYEAVLQDSVVQNQTLANDGDITWSSQDGNPADARDGTGGINDYTATDNQSAQTETLLTAVKSVTATSATHTSGVDLVIGEVATFSIVITTIEGTTSPVTVTDTLPADLNFVAGTLSVTQDAGGTTGFVNEATSLTYVDPVMTLNLGTIVNPGDNNTLNDTVTVTFDAIVANTTTNQHGQNKINTVTVTDTVTIAADSASVDIVEPELDITIQITNPLPATELAPGTVITYQIDVDHPVGTTPDAFDALISDLMDNGSGDILITSIISTTLAGGATTDAAAAITGGGTGLSGQFDMPQGSTVSIVFEATTQATASGPFDSDATVTWSSLDGPPARSTDGLPVGARDGADGVGGALDDYAAEDTVAAVAAFLDLTKAIDSTDQAHTSDPNVVIGETITYEVTVSVNEDGLTNVVFTDTLPDDINFQAGTVSTAFGNGGMSTSSAIVSYVDPVLTVTYGTITNPANGNTNDDTMTITYDAIVANTATNQNGLTKINTALITNGAGTSSSDTFTATVVEPDLQVNKSITNPSPATGLGPGIVVTYTTTIDHTGSTAADAFDVILTDTIDGASGDVLITSIVSTTLNGGSTTDVATAITGGGTGLSGQYDIPQGGSVVIVYEATIQASVSFGATISNNAVITWASADGNPATARDGAGGVDDYTDSDSDSFTTATPAATKTVLATSDAGTSGSNVAIAETITYQVVLEVPQGTLPTVDFQDTLPDDINFVSGTFTFTLGNAGITTGFVSEAYADPVLTASFGPVTNPVNASTADDTITITYDAIVADSATNSHGLTKPNAIAINYGSGSASSSAVVTIVEPSISVAKTATDVTRCQSPASAPQAGDQIEYTLTFTEANGAPAYDISITDTLPELVTYDASYTPTVSGTGNTIGAPTITGTGGVGDPQILTWSLGDANADIDVPASGSVAVTYAVLVDLSVGPGASLTNTAVIGYTSADGVAAGERGPPTYQDSDGVTLITKASGGNFTITASRRRNPTFIDADGNIVGPRGPGPIDANDTITMNDGAGVTITGDGISGPPPAGAPDVTVTAGATATINTDGTNTFQYGVLTISDGATLTLTGDTIFSLEELSMGAGSTLIVADDSDITVNGPCLLDGDVGTSNYALIQSSGDNWSITFNCGFIGDHFRFEDIGTGTITFNDTAQIDYGIFTDGCNGGSYIEYNGAPDVTWTNLAFECTCSPVKTTIETGVGGGQVTVDSYAQTIATRWCGGDSTDDENGGAVLWANATPVRHLSGVVDHSDTGVRIAWETRTESGVSHFLVERAPARRDRASRWHIVGKTFSIAPEFGDGDYEFVDTTAKAGSAYDYRVTVVDLDESHRWYPLGSIVAQSYARVAVPRSAREELPELPQADVFEPTFEAAQHATHTATQTGTGRYATVERSGLYSAPETTVYNAGQPLARVADSAVFIRGLSDFYTDTNVVWTGDLTITGAPGVVPAPQPDGYLDAQGYLARHRAEVNESFSVNFGFPAGPNWYYAGRINASSAIVAEVTVPAKRSGTAYLVVQVRANTDTAHRMQIALAGTPVGEAQWFGNGYRHCTIAIDASQIQIGTNTVTLSTRETDADLRLDWAELQVPAHANGGSGLLVEVRDSSDLQITGGDLAVDITRFGNERNIGMFNGQVPALRAGQLVYVGPIRPLTWQGPVSLHQDVSQAEYIVVAPADFVPLYADLLAHHERNGLTTAILSLDDVKQQFGGGLFGPAGIVQLTNAAPALRYLLLGAGTTYDYKNYEGRETPTGIPTGWVQVAQGLAASDDIYTRDLQVAVGRLPGRRAEEITAAIDKILTFQAPRHAMLIAGHDDSQGGEVDRFHLGQQAASEIFPSTVIGPSQGTGFSQLVEGVQAGGRFIAYQGHGGYGEIGDSIMRARSIPEVPTSVWLLSTCLTGSYIINDDSFTVFARDLLGTPSAGGALVIASTRYGDSGIEHQFIESALRYMADNGGPWGEYLLQMKREYASETTQVFQLFGDPAMLSADFDDDREIVLIRPRGGDFVGAEGSVTVAFRLEGTWANETLRLSFTQDGTTWTPIQEVQVQSDVTQYELQWQPPADGSDYQIRIDVPDEQ